MFKRAIIAVLCTVFVGAIVSCSVFPKKDVKDTSDNKVGKIGDEISAWAWDENFNILALEEAAEIYKEINPNVTLNVTTVALNDIVKKLNTGLISADYASLPEIILMEDYKIQHFLNQFPDDFREFGHDVNIDDFIDYKHNIVMKDGGVYGIPFDSGVAALFYRIDFIEQAGITKEDMQDLTWEEYIAIGKRVKAATGKPMLTLEPSDLAPLRIMLQSAGEWYVKSDGKTVNIYENQALRDSIVIHKAMLDSGIAKPISDWNAYLDNIHNSQVASVPIGCWTAPSIMLAPEQKGKWGVASIPRMGANPNSVNASNNGGGSWYVLNKKPNAYIAEDFLVNTFASSTELINSLIEDINLVSTLEKASSCPNYYAKSPFFDNEEIAMKFSEWTQKIPAVNYGENTTELESVVCAAIAQIVSGADIDSTLLEAQRKGEDVIMR